MREVFSEILEKIYIIIFLVIALFFDILDIANVLSRSVLVLEAGNF